MKLNIRDRREKPYLRPEGEVRRAVVVHERELAGEELPPAGIVVDVDGQLGPGVVDGEASVLGCILVGVRGGEGPDDVGGTMAMPGAGSQAARVSRR